VDLTALGRDKQTGTVSAERVAGVLMTAGLPEERRRALADEYAGRAVALLRAAVEKGFDDLDRLRKNVELEPLRSRADFHKLVRDLEEKLKKRAG
jgi:hypothetical protein